MFQNISLKTKILVPVFSLITVLIILAGIIIVFNYSKIVTLSDLNKKIIFSNIISRTIYSLQKERGLSSGYITSKNINFKQELSSQRKTTDSTITLLKEYSKTIPIFKNLPIIRKNIDNHLITSNKLIEQYSIINAHLIKIIVNIAKISHLPKITQNILGYVNLLYLKENAGIQRALGISILSKEHIDLYSLSRFSNLIALEKQNEFIMIQYSSKQIKSYYDEITKIETFKKVKNIENSIITTKFLDKKIDAKIWYDLMTKKLNLLERMSKYIEIDTTKKIQTELSNSKKIFIFIITLTFTSILAFSLIIIAVLRLVNSELQNIKIKNIERKDKAKEELMQQKYRLTQMGETISMIAHQWRQPLSAITATSGVINMKASMNKLDNKTAITLSEKIKEFAMHLSHTIDDFRDFFKPNKTKTKTNYKKVMDSVLLIIEDSLKKNNIELVLKINSIIELETYENELKQVLLNLIKNAQDALIEKKIKYPKIVIEVDDIYFSISDNAGGIDKNIIQKIFNPYFSTKIQKDGTGLGLYMSKIIIEDHCKGTLSVSNDEFGAVFIIMLGEYNA